MIIMNIRNVFLIVTVVILASLTIFYAANYFQAPGEVQYTTQGSPTHPVRLVFIHHSVGQNWLADDNGGLALALQKNNYLVSDTNYGWGPDAIGDKTDIGHWWLWFRGPDSQKYLDALYTESGQTFEYSRIKNNSGGENTIIVFKSCFISSALKGNPEDPIPSIENNPLKGQDSSSEYHTVANAKGIYLDLLEYFKTKQDKLFIVITVPPSIDPTYAENTRAFNQWLVEDWLKDYPYKNVVVFDLYSILTNNGTTLVYPSGIGDDHPSQAGNQKATNEFIGFINRVYGNWSSS